MSNCRSCAYFIPNTEISIGGFCRRFPPQFYLIQSPVKMDDGSIVPMLHTQCNQVPVKNDDWCAEYESMQ